MNMERSPFCTTKSFLTYIARDLDAATESRIPRNATLEVFHSDNHVHLKVDCIHRVQWD